MKYNRESQVFLPLLINITDKRILVVGGGKVAAHKLLSLLRFTSNITVLAPYVIDEIKNDRRLKFLEKTYETDDLLNYHIVFACTNERNVNSKIKKEANALGLPVNVADDPELCDFISPAIYKDNNITVAVSSNARDVKRSIRIRNRIELLLENEDN